MKKIDSVDRLSTLPDSILHHIFSSLETREIVQPSLLSRRWRDLWTSTPYLNFVLTRSKSKFSPLSSSEKIDRKCFVNFVYRVLILRDAVSTVQNLHLYSESVLDEGHVLTWLMGALKRNVKVLHLELHLNKTLDLPPDLFTSGITTLTVIDNVFEDEFTIQVPNAVCSAARITYLRLEYVKLPEGTASDGELVLSCPVLENLTIFSCDDKHLKTLTISSPLLKRLDFTNEDLYDDPFKLNVCSPNLTSIYLFCWGYVDISLVNLAVVVSACINILRYEEMDKEVYAQLMIKVFRMISNIRALSLPAEVIKEIADSSMILEKLPSVFQNLKNIMLDDGGADGILATTFSIAKVLMTSPSIQVFVWDRTKSKPPNLKKKGKDKGEKLSIQSFLCSLRIVKIQNPHGVEDELKFLEFVLKSAIYLKEIIITTTQKTRRLTEFCQKLLALPQSSSSVSMHCSC